MNTPRNTTRPVFTFPCSFAQARLWFLERLAPGTSAYNIPSAHRLRGPLDEEALAGALDALVERHETLRTTFADAPGDGGEPVQRIAERGRCELVVKDGDGALAELLASEARRPFSLERGPLLRALLVRRAPREHVLLLTLHHSVADGWSLGVLARDLEEAYAAALDGRAPRWPELPIQYADFAHWQREHLEEAVSGHLLDFWKQHLGPDPRPLELPADHPRSAVRGARGGRWTFELPAALTGRLAAVGRGRGATLFMVLLSAFEALLVRWSGRCDPVVGTPVASRDRPELEGLIGLFANLLPLRVDLGGDPSLHEALDRVRRALLAALEHRGLPFERLVRELRPERELSRDPLVQVTFSLEEGIEEPLALRGLDSDPLDVAPGAAKFDLSLALRRRGDRLDGVLGYDEDLFDATTMMRLGRQLEAVLETLVTAPETPLSRLPLLAAAERFQLLREWNDTVVAQEPRDVLSLVRRWVDATPEAVALEGPGARLTYGELGRRARRVAGALRRRGVGPEVPVAVWARPGPGMVVAILGVLEAGGAYLPLDPEAPLPRVAFMIEDAGAPVVLVDGVDAGAVPDDGGSIGGAVCLQLNELGLDELEPDERGTEKTEVTAAPAAAPAPEQRAYLIYTSGSTGRPKGVELTHGGLANLAAWHRRLYGVGPEDRASQVANPAFDAAVWEVWPYLTAGAALCFPPEEHRLSPPRLARWLTERRVSLAFLPTPLGEAILELDEELDELGRAGALRAMLVGGDKLHWPRRTDLPFRLVNHYGPSEATVVSTWAEVETGAERRPAAPPIGRPVDATRVYVLDDHLRPVAVGAVGELLVGGRALGRGYRGRPGWTAAAFVPDPFAETPGGRLYRTGDLARWLPDGRLEFRGRRDHQVKIRGFRIELGEIEAALRRHEAIREAVVAVHSDGTDRGAGARLAAFVVPRPGLRPPAPEELESFLRTDLPGYMVPGSVVFLDALPLTPNGKLDREALPWDAAGGAAEDAAEGAAGGRGGAEEPATPVEEIVAGVWAEVLGVERVGRGADFFALGGHSLLVNRVMVRLAEVFGVELPLRALFEEPTVAGLARRLEEARERARGGEASASPPALEPALEPAAAAGSAPEPVPASFAQERVWFLDRLEGGGAAYNLPVALALDGALSLPALAAALGEIVRRHPILRTRFAFAGGRVTQVIEEMELSAVDLSVADLSGLPEEARSTAGRRLLSEEAHRPFDLERGLPLRIRLFRLTPEEHILLLGFHHIAADGRSLEVFLDELGSLAAAFAAGGPSPLTEPRLQYRDFALWQRRWLRGEALEREVGYWRQRLAGAPPSLELPADRPRRPTRSFRGGSLRVAAPREPVEALRALARRSGATGYMALLAVFDALLFRLTGQRDLVVGSPVANRSRSGLERMIGFFANTLALRVRLTGGETFGGLLGRVRDAALGAYAHQDLPFEKLVEALNPERDASRNPVFQVAFSTSTASRRPLRLPGVEARRVEIPATVSKFDLLLAVAEREEGGGALELAYSSDLFDAATVRRFAHGFLTLLAEAAAAPDRPIGELALVSGAERHQIFYEWGEAGPVTAEPAGAVETVRRWAARAPERIAVVAGDGSLTYRGLARRARRLAGQLRRLGCGPETLVGVFAERSAEVVVSLLAILEAGGVYLPLDPDNPAERIAYMIADSRVPMVLTRSPRRLTLPDSEPAPRQLDLDELLAAAPEDGGAGDGDPGDGGTWEDDPSEDGGGVGGERLAYVIYTSGSSGRPKGTALTHRGLAHLMEAQALAFGLGPQDRFSQFASLSFDASIFEIAMAWRAGGTLVLVPPDERLGGEALAAHLDRHRVTTATLPPSVATSLDPEGVPELRRLVVAGEACPPELARRWAGRLVFFNAYGPTEDTVWSTVERCSPGGGEASVPIGRPVAGERVRVLDRRLAPVPAGVAGELCLGGAGLARGYLGRPGLTAERFVPDPAAVSPGARLYRTGDLARFLPDGRLEFLGRIDQQVKIRGVRVEPGEIEAVLGAHPALGEVAVVARPAAGGGTQLAAFFTAPGPVPPVEELREFLAARLPEAMVPAVFAPLDALPTNPSGKVDRRALRSRPLQQRPRLQVDYRAPHTETERLLVELWCEVLGIDKVGIDDNFFDLGGHSLQLVQLQQRIIERLGLQVAVVDLFGAPTVASFARALRQSRRQRRARSRPEGSAAAPDTPDGRDGRGSEGPANRQTAAKTRLARQLALRRRAVGGASPEPPHRSAPPDRDPEKRPDRQIDSRSEGHLGELSDETTYKPEEERN